MAPFVSIRQRHFSTLCILVLLFGTTAQAMPASRSQPTSATRAVQGASAIKHWQSSLSYTLDSHHVVSEGSVERSAGLLVTISTRLCKPTDIRFRSLVPGRVLHVRLNAKGSVRSCCMLTAHMAFHSHLCCQQLRSEVWMAIDDCLASTPQRSIAILAGDMNTQIPALPGLTGTAALARSGRQESDSD